MRSPFHYLKRLVEIKRQRGWRHLWRFISFQLFWEPIGKYLDRRQDMKICGVSLTKYVPSLYRESMGATGSHSTSYSALEIIFQNVNLTEKDRFIDIGCGKGRVLAFLIRNKFTGKITGIELNEQVANYAMQWVTRYPNINVIHGNAFELNLDSYTIMFLGRPFETDVFIKFVDKIENEMTHELLFIYWCDQVNGNYIDNRKGWHKHKREKIYKVNKIPIFTCPQRYTIWSYNPLKK